MWLLFSSAYFEFPEGIDGICRSAEKIEYI